MSKKKVHSTTQDFIEIVDIVDSAVFFKDRSAASLVEVSSVNFFLLSSDEQNARLYGYMALLNSLSFPIQILIVSKRVDLTTYLKLLDQRIIAVQNTRVKEHLSMYKDFIQELLKGEGLLDKKTYVVIPFSPLELGAVKGTGGKRSADFMQKAQGIIATKRNNVVAQIQRMGLSVRVLGPEELAKAFYELYNQEALSLDFNTSDVKNILL